MEVDITGDSLPSISGMLALSSSDGVGVPKTPAETDDLESSSLTPPVMARYMLAGNIQEEIETIEPPEEFLLDLSGESDTRELSDLTKPTGKEGFSASFDGVRELIEAADIAITVLWIPRSIAALDLAPTAGTKRKVSRALQSCIRREPLLVRSNKMTRIGELGFEITQRVRAVEQRLDSLRSVNEDTILQPLILSPVLGRQTTVDENNRVTRSKGKVPDYPRVQPVTLEYRRKQAPSSTEFTPSGEE
jgi:hypothetical protein